MNPHHRDQDKRCVVVTWDGTHSASLADPNDEAISGHRLHGNGLSDVSWAGVVRDSELVRALERQNSVHPSHDPARFDALTHYVLLTKERVAEVVAGAVTVTRTNGNTLDAAAEAIRR
jgi:hypothetical protein